MQNTYYVILDELAAFLAVHAAGGVGREASSLGRSQPAISQRIEQLESKLGCSLLERSPSAGVTGLTEAGRSLLPHAEAALANVQDAVRAVDAVHRSDGGEVTLAIVGTLASTGLPALIARFTKSCPKARLKVRTASSAGVSALVRAGDATLGLRYGDDDDHALEATRIGADRLIAVVGGALAERLSQNLGADALRGIDWLGFPPDQSTGAFGDTLLRLLISNGLDTSTVIPVDSLSVQLRLVEAGLGLGLLPMSFVADALNAGSVAVAPGRLQATVPITMIHRRNGYLSAAARRLQGHIISWGETA